MASAKFNVEIRERPDGQEDYVRPAILREAEEQAEKEANASGSDNSEEDEESEEDSDVDEDEDAALLTPAIDKQIFRTLAALQTKDPKVYDRDSKFFSEADVAKAKTDWKAKSKAKNESPQLLVKDYQRDVLLKHKGFIDEEEHQPKIITHVQEQASIKNEFKKAAQEDEEEEGDDDTFFTKKEKTDSELKEEEDSYKSFLLESLAKDDTASAETFKQWSNYKENPNISKDDAFLMGYVLNRGWVDTKEVSQTDTADVDQDEEYLDEVDRFESKYNFRFEEEGGGQIISYGRKIEGSMRREESKRAKRRAREKANKERKKLLQAEEVKRLKNEKRKEIQERLREIKSIAGADLPGFDEVDLDGDFDPEKHDKLMASAFDDDYYNEAETEKPVWDDDDDLMMDADYLPGGDMYTDVSQGESSRKVDKDPSLLAQRKKEYEELMDEYYNLDISDVVGGDTPMRFKYVKTEPEDFGMTAEEILMTDDAELNRIASVKLLARFKRKDEREHKRVQKRLHDFRRRSTKADRKRQEREEQEQMERQEKAKTAKKGKNKRGKEDASDVASKKSKKSKKSAS